MKKMDTEKKTEEASATKEEPKAESEPVAPPAKQKESPSEPKAETASQSEESEKKVEEKGTPSPTHETTIQELERDTTRAQRVISLFEKQGTTTPNQEQPLWKVNAQQQRAEKEKLEREKEIERQKEKDEEENKEKEDEKSRTSSNASSQKEPEPVVNGSVDAASDDAASSEKEFVDGATISKTKNMVSSSNVTKSASDLPSMSNKNDEVIHRDNKLKKAGSSTGNVLDPKKRLMVEEAKGKRSSWAAPKREECAVCGKVVYVMERLEADKVVYHKTCFKCSVCNKTLSTGTYAALQGKIYCKTHFKQLFKMKGNYDEGFGREQHKTKWLKKDQLDGESEA